MIRSDQQLLIPSRQLLELAEHTTETLHHENFGFLSEARGFMPCYEPLACLPDFFSCWDEVARELPSLHSSLNLRARLDQLPILDASQQHLPDTALLRASHILSMLSHAYMYVECKQSAALPESLRVPWEIVSRRLGRTESTLTYIDLIVYNWRFVNSNHDDPFRVENLNLLTPTVNTVEECNFYLTQTEILAQCTPVIGAVVRGQEAMARHDGKALKQELQKIADCLKHVTWTSLTKINPMRSSKYYVDPVIWAKMVAPFAVPMQRGHQGPSGTASPIFGLLDAFLGRKRNTSFLGQEILSLRRTYPCFWREFLEAVERVPAVLSYVSTTKDTELVDLVNELMRLYAGDDGFLGRHKRKVYGYLELAFKVGRDLTIGGFSGVFKDRAWNTVDAELEQSRRERHGDGSVSAKSPVEAYVPHEKLDHEYPVSELLIHNNDCNGYWLAIEGNVYDVTKFMQKHPGGSHTLAGYAGTDATQGFLRAHAGQSIPRAMMDRFRIGKLKRVEFVTGITLPSETLNVVRNLYERYLNFSYMITEMQNAITLDHRLQTSVTNLGESVLPRSLYKLQRAIESQDRFFRNYFSELAGPRLEELETLTSQLAGLRKEDSIRMMTECLQASDAFQRVSNLPSELFEKVQKLQTGVVAELSMTSITEVCQFLESHTQWLLAEVKATLVKGLCLFELTEAMMPDALGNSINQIIHLIPNILGLYCDKITNRLQHD